MGADFALMKYFTLTLEACGGTREEAIAQALRVLSGLVAHPAMKNNSCGGCGGNASADIKVHER